MKFYPLTMELFVVKSMALDGVAMKSGQEKYIPVKEYDVAKDVERKKKAQSLTTKPYRPRVMRNIRKNVVPQYDRHERTKSLNNR